MVDLAIVYLLKIIVMVDQKEIRKIDQIQFSTSGQFHFEANLHVLCANVQVKMSAITLKCQ